jgi:hypothetical protein
MKNLNKRILMALSFIMITTSACGTIECKRQRECEPYRFERINYRVVNC